MWRRYFQLEEQKEYDKEMESNHEASQIVGDSATRNNTDERSDSTGDPVRSEWARKELNDFRRLRCANNSNQQNSQSQNQRHQQQDTQQHHHAPFAIPTSAVDHPDLRVNGMFLPQ
jgi:hypothetical protein